MYREKTYAFINISGLSLGIACCIILGLLLRSELTYDRHNLKHDRIFRIVGEMDYRGVIETWATSPEAWGPLLARDYPEAEGYVRFRSKGRTLLRHEDKSAYWESIYLADDQVLDIFDHDIIYGDPETALSDPYSMAVSESFAKKYFGDENPIGKIIADGSEKNKITLVFADLPENSHLRYDALLSYNRLNHDAAQLEQTAAAGASVFTYLLMPKGYQADSFQDIWGPFFDRYLEKEYGNKNYTINAWLEPLADIHLKSKVNYDLPRGNSLHLYAFAAVAIFILMIACINYMNLATARSMKRGREVGIRKVMGATRAQLIARFLGESAFFTLIALLIGIILVKAAFIFTPVNDLLGKHRLMDFSYEPVLLLWIAGLSLVTGLISGIYPALYLSSVQPITALKDRNPSGKQGFPMRQTLVFIQFSISIAVIASTILMAVQMHYINSKPLGFKKENRVIIPLRGADLIEKYPVLKQELLKDSRILDAAKTIHLQGKDIWQMDVSMENNDGVMEERQLVRWMGIGDDFIKVMGMELAAGREYSGELKTDTRAGVLVNETMVKKMGWKEPVGKHIQRSGKPRRIIGVVKDFNFLSLHQQVEPLFIVLNNINYANIPPDKRAGSSNILIVNISGDDIPGTLKYIRKLFAKFDPGHSFEYEFLDDILDKPYVSERRLMKLTGIFSGICILISCLGLFGLAAFNTEQRTKEIGVRKVLGATTLQIIVMLSRSILLIVLMASIAASPVAWFAIDEWLTEFAYHAGINPLVFVLAAALTMAVAFGTVALQSFKTAQANPVKALRYE